MTGFMLFDFMLVYGIVGFGMLTWMFGSVAVAHAKTARDQTASAGKRVICALASVSSVFLAVMTVAWFFDILA